MPPDAQGTSARSHFEVGVQKESLRTEGPEAVIPAISPVALSCDDVETAPDGTRRHQNASSEASSRYSHSMASVLTSRHSSCAQFSVPSRAECRQVTPCRVSSAPGTKAETTSRTIFKLRALSFLFLSQGARRAAFRSSISTKTPVLKLKCLFACEPPAAIGSESTQVAFKQFAKLQVAGLHC